MSGSVIQLFMHGFAGETIVINTPENDSIENLYAVVAERTGIETQSVKLFHESKQLAAEKDGKTMYLKDYGLENQDSILMTVRLAVGHEEKQLDIECSEEKTVKADCTDMLTIFGDAIEVDELHDEVDRKQNSGLVYVESKHGPPIVVDEDDLELRLLQEKKAQLEATKARLEKEKKKAALRNEIGKLEAETKALCQQSESEAGKLLWSQQQKRSLLEVQDPRLKTDKKMEGLTIKIGNMNMETRALNKQGETQLRGDIIRIFLKGIDGKTFTIYINKDASIEELFVAASQRTNIHDRDSMRLLYCSKDLRTHENRKVMHLKDYKLKNLSTIFMVLRLRGGSLDERHFAIGARLTDLPDMLGIDDDQAKRALMPCGHAIGPNSLVMFCSNQVESGKFDFRCPVPTCGKRWDYSDVRNIVRLSEAEEVSYETKLTENFIQKSLEFQECPQCKSLCEKTGKKDICVICPVCTGKTGKRYEFCWYCLKKWSSPNYQRCSNPDCDGTDPRVKFLRKVERKEIGGVKNCPSVRACPKCGLLIEHVDKCKHMDCRCGQKFCFICIGVPINGNWQCGAHNSACNVAPVQEEIPGN